MIARVFIILVLFCSIVGAQTQSTKTVGPVWISVYAEGSPEAFQGLSYMSSGQELSVPIVRGKRGSQFRYSGAQELVFFVNVAGQNGAPSRRVERARVTLPQSSTEVLVMLGEKSGRMGMTAIDITPTRFPVGSIMVLNYTPVPVALQIGAKEGVAQPQVPAFFGPFSGADGNLRYKAAMNVEGEWKIITQNSYSIRPNMRCILLLRPDTNPLKPRFVWINDHVAPGVAAQPAIRR